MLHQSLSNDKGKSVMELPELRSAIALRPRSSNPIAAHLLGCDAGGRSQYSYSTTKRLIASISVCTAAMDFSARAVRSSLSRANSAFNSGSLE
jgi:hypothetical protein